MLVKFVSWMLLNAVLVLVSLMAMAGLPGILMSSNEDLAAGADFIGWAGPVAG
jgi:hypothetical protein